MDHTRLFIMSDIHGSLLYLRKALERFRAERADYLILLGDELYHGARNPLPEGYSPKEVAETLDGYADRIMAVRGNCDSEVDEMVLKFPIMSAYSSVLAAGRRLFLTHGHIFSPERRPELCRGDVFLSGHTHLPGAELSGGIAIVNPGSVSIPKGDSPHSYAVLQGDKVELRDLDGNVFRELRLPPAG